MNKDLTLLQACIGLLQTTLGSDITSVKADIIVAQVISLLKLLNENK